MFGNLRIKSCGLPGEQKDFYRATFCTTCHALHQFGGRWTSLTTNYDITLWLALAQALDSEPLRELKRPCTALPIQKVSVYAVRPELGATAAALNLALIGAKLKDNVDDGSSVWAIADSAFGKKRRKAESYLETAGFPVRHIRELPQKQVSVENGPGAGLDSYSEPTREALAASFEFLSDLLDMPGQAENLSQFGHALGGYLYLWDAVVDRLQDHKLGHFNPLEVTGLTPSEVRQLLMSHLKSMELLLEELPLRRHDELFQQLLGSLSSNVNSRFPKPETASTLRRPYRAQAAYLRIQECGRCEFGCKSCCEVDCCPCGESGCGVECCNCNPCSCCCCCCGGD